MTVPLILLQIAILSLGAAGWIYLAVSTVAWARTQLIRRALRKAGYTILNRQQSFDFYRAQLGWWCESLKGTRLLNRRVRIVTVCGVATPLAYYELMPIQREC